jgi:CDP-4-dehydro-6-deoxyglucose reductase
MRCCLQLPANDTFQYHAGQYVEFILRDGARRSYSMANAPHTLIEGPAGRAAHPPHARRQVHRPRVQRHEGKGNPAHRRALRQLSPARRITQADGAAGLGHGFRAIKAIIEHMQFMGITRPAVLYWGGRRPQDLYLDDWVRAKTEEMPHLRYVPVVSDALPEDGWGGRTGFVHRAVLQDLADLSGHQVYACGAPIVVDSARQDFVEQAGLPEEEFFADAFTSEADKAHG